MANSKTKTLRRNAAIYEPSPTCRGDGCLDAATVGGRCETHWDFLLREIIARAKRPYRDACTFYVGRTNFPSARLLEHFVSSDGELTCMAVFHWSACTSETAELETRLIAHFLEGRRKSVNKVAESAGTFSSSWNCVYGFGSHEVTGP